MKRKTKIGKASLLTSWWDAYQSSGTLSQSSDFQKLLSLMTSSVGFK